ncbi:C2H2 type zinc-finger protein [Rhizoctonia solani AG-3 Rhs1AP]|uniref:C2H2 type zinc-finger protein n=1 Tax=Rhizoctonia solani AG-3 Rhs1AP TaxID=1086054 RepID=X8J642_9AGAM|nr:C2H2 type zinc-finger protein [Rhizoctonia solani AG-3 Rhs1AP]
MAYCERCNRGFGSDYAYAAHQRDSPRHYVCFPCNIDFPTYERLNQHFRKSSRHPHYCSFCDEDFYDDYDLSEHDEQCHEYCNSCDLWVDTTDDLVEHNKNSHYYCVECNRFFMNMNNLQAHLNSSRHRPKNVSCPGVGCTDRFVSKSALLLHFEGGGCKSGLTRQSLNRLIAERDRSNFITNPNRLITGTTETWATQRAWNGSSYECYFCHKGFLSLPQLNQHLASPAHEQALYHCPQLGHGCQSQFRTLSGLCQHIENGSCGVARFKVVQDSMAKLIGGMNRLTFR